MTRKDDVASRSIQAHWTFRWTLQRGWRHGTSVIARQAPNGRKGDLQWLGQGDQRVIGRLMCDACLPVDVRQVEGQEERRQVATQDRDALTQFVDPAKASGLLDGVPGLKVVILGSSVGELEGTTQDEARDAWANRKGITWWPEARDAELARQHREGIT